MTPSTTPKITLLRRAPGFKNYGNLALIVGSCIISFLALWQYRSITIDDAYITFTYSKNLFLGRGPVFVPGEHVEATSSFLWALVLVPFEMLTVGSVLGSKLLGTLTYLAAIVTVFHAVNSRTSEKTRQSWLFEPGLVAVFFAVNTGAYLNWTIQGMENPLVALLLILSVHLLSKELDAGIGISSAAPIILLHASRPEGFVFSALFIALRTISAIARGSLNKPFFRTWIFIVLLLLALYEIWGLTFYGALMPNTVSAKVPGIPWAQISQGWGYVISTPCVQVLIMAATIVLLATMNLGYKALHYQREALPSTISSTPILIGTTILVLQLCFSVFTGGDWMPGGRFVSHLGPLLGLLFVLSAAQFEEIFLLNKRLFSYFFQTTLLLIAGLYMGYGFFVVAREHHILKWVDDNSKQAIEPIIEYVNKTATATDILAASDVGRLGYFFNGSVFDWWGLAAPEVVKKGEALGNIRAETVLSKQPRFIVLYLGAPSLDNADAFGGFGGVSKQFMENQDFRSNYSLALITKFTDGRYHALFERNVPKINITD